MSNVIEVKNLVKQYKELKAIDNLSFEVREGEILGLLGPNGSGKSTTINCILSLLNYSKGSIKIFGKEMNVLKNVIVERELVRVLMANVLKMIILVQKL